LAGFMRIISPVFVNQFSNKIINIHPSLLPKFKGTTNAIEQAFLAKEAKTGVTVHFVTENVDCGPIIIQEELAIDQSDNLRTLEEKIHRLEHKLYPQAVEMIIKNI